MDLISENLKIKCLICQFDSKFKDIKSNVSKIETSILPRYTSADKIDVILFPEMCLTGYHFKDKEDISPYTEICGEGQIFTFSSNLATKLNCYVICGYAEKVLSSDNSIKYYNSAYIVNRDGKLLNNYRKHHLYEVDDRWSEEGPSFLSLKLINSDGKEFKAVVAICMDINSYKFIDETKFELADFIKETNSDALFFLTAWKDSEPGEDNGDSIKHMLNYWIYRVSPIITSDKNKKENAYKRWAFFCSGRVGKEEETVFTGCSCALKFNPLKFVGCLDKRNDGYLMAEVNLE